MHSSLGEFVWVYGGYDQLVLGGGFHMTHFATDNGDAKGIEGCLSGVFGYFLPVFLLFIFVFKWFQPYLGCVFLLSQNKARHDLGRCSI